MKFARVTEMLVSVLDAGYVEYLWGHFHPAKAARSAYKP